MKIGILKPDEAGKKARAAVAEWEAGKKAARLRAAAGKPVAVAPAAGKVLEPQEKKRLNDKLLEAAERGDKAEVERLLRAGADVDERGYVGETALITASVYGHAEIVELLIGNGADVNAKNSSGGTALMWASQNGHGEVVELLIGKGADVNAGREGETALIMASVNGHNEIVEMLRKAGATG